jgi:C1A family cysteine protease
LDTSKSGGLSDVHVITDTGSCFVFESKNKSAISVQDVEKSYADIQLLASHYGDRLKGYIFVSHRTRSIPRKGHLHIERKDNIYIAWIGVNENETCLDVYVVTILKLFASLGNVCILDESKNFDTLTNTLKEKLGMLVDNMKICTTLQENINTMAHSLNSMQNNNKELYDSILHVSGLTPEKLTNCRPMCKGDKGVTKRSLQCSHCDATFKRKCDLTQHLGKCVKIHNN